MAFFLFLIEMVKKYFTALGSEGSRMLEAGEVLVQYLDICKGAKVAISIFTRLTFAHQDEIARSEGVSRRRELKSKSCRASAWKSAGATWPSV